MQEVQQPYAGSWTLEEKEYATALMEDFRDGIIGGLCDKATLRNFLAERLGCLTKRISKKYEKSGYNGRLQYRSGVAGMGPEEVKRRQDRRDELEKRFLVSRQAILQWRGAPSGAALSGGLNRCIGSSAQSANQGQTSVSKVAPAETPVQAVHHPNLKAAITQRSLSTTVEETKPNLSNRTIVGAMLSQSTQRGLIAAGGVSLMNRPSLFTNEQIVALARNHSVSSSGLTLPHASAAAQGGGAAALNRLNLLALRDAAGQNLSSKFPHLLSGGRGASTIGSSLASSLPSPSMGGALTTATRHLLLKALRQQQQQQLQPQQQQQGVLAERRKREPTPQTQDEQSAAKRPRYFH